MYVLLYSTFFFSKDDQSSASISIRVLIPNSELYYICISIFYIQHTNNIQKSNIKYN